VRAPALVSTLAAVALSGCGSADDPPDVVAAFYPLAWAASEIAPGLDVRNLTPPGAEPHDVELAPRDAEAIRGAALVVFAGGGFQPAVEDALRDRDGAVFDVVPAGEGDPHVWLDPAAFAAITELFGAALERPEEGSELADRLRDLDGEYLHGLATCRRRVLVTTHAAFGHLAARYGLTQLALAGLSPESEPGPRELERLVDDVRASGATTVFAEPLVSDRLAETVAREAGVEVATLDPIEGLGEERLAAGEDYLSVMRDNLVALRKALGCR
jgi:zinc transport system substrate-binding protein